MITKNSLHACEPQLNFIYNISPFSSGINVEVYAAEYVIRKLKIMIHKVRLIGWSQERIILDDLHVGLQKLTYF